MIYSFIAILRGWIYLHYPLHLIVFQGLRVVFLLVLGLFVSYKGGHYVDLIGINLTTQRVRIADPDRGIIEYHMDEFKEGMLLNSQPALIVISKK